MARFKNPLPPRPDTSGLADHDLLTREEVAGFHRVSPRTVREWTDDGLLVRAVTPGRLARYRWADVRDFDPDA